MQPILLSKLGAFSQPNHTLFPSTFPTLRYILLHCELQKGRGCLICSQPMVLITISGTHDLQMWNELVTESSY